MGQKLEKIVEKEIIQDINQMGLDIEYVEFVKDGDITYLRVVLDKPNGIVQIEDCEAVSRKIEDKIQKKIEIEYILEVSSPGLERELKSIELYNKYVGNEIFVKLYKKFEDKKELVGILKNVDLESKNITLEMNDKDVIFNLKDISNAHTTYDFDSVFNKKGAKDNMNLNKLGKF